MNYMGIDHHKQYSHITMLNEKGKKLKSGRVANYRSELERFLDGSGEVKAVIKDKNFLFSWAGWMSIFVLIFPFSHREEI